MLTAVHIFNPETDYALALGRKTYNAPASIVRLRHDMALFPATFARQGDWIVVDNDLDKDCIFGSPFFHQAEEKQIEIIPLSNLAERIKRQGDNNVKILPWGWNHTLRQSFVNAGVSPLLLKTEEEIDTLRCLSHRRTAIKFQNSLRDMLPGLVIPIVREFTDAGSALEFYRKTGDVFFKLPWSSSGRGVIRAGSMDELKLEQWLKGGIRRQGAVMGEEAMQNAADFATEWECSDGEVRFLGLSLFETSPDGKYLGNVAASQKEIEQRIAKLATTWDAKIVDAQRKAIEQIIGPHYSGPVGIDMLAATDGSINPCIEINLRQTMGMAALIQNMNL